ncbi:uncharacterized protein PAC_10392 [Phialocephala subalpina]|uniref:Uncharacterized protein n=1 Tax=Phialocephala subalpina TaxID=576137 RepID=A0A1L7X643_9HELO|nr:uncharacterized protein PAC_10392 [Phialocephala subalpina]
MSQSQVPEIILYHYTFSPYAKRIVWYLNFRKIPYTQCLQPPTLPRPDIKALGTNYRRIPILSIGRDIYNDTRLILSKLDQLFPPSSVHPSISAPEHKGLEKLFEKWSIDGGLFRTAGALLPAELPLLKDPKFRRDREDYTGTSWSPENVARGRAEALVEMKSSFEMVENNFLRDGREWIAGTKEPSLTDIEAIWLFHWLNGLPGALPVEFKQQFPKVFAWVDRFDKVTRAAAKEAGKPKTVKGPEAREIIQGSGFAESEGQVERSDPSGLRKGTTVEVWPTDSGFNHKDRGVLVGLTEKEIVVEGEMEDGTGVRVHAPRHGFRMREAKGGANL